MKKMNVLFAGAAALALLMGACMLFDQGEPEPVYDEYGNRMVSLTLFTGDGGRNMTQAIGKVGINYYEVVFLGKGTLDPATGPDRYFRAAGPRGKPLTVRLPVGLDVGGATKSIAFAGNWTRETDERRLLAVAKVDCLNYGLTDQTTTLTITESTRNIRYVLYSFETRFDTSTGSSFKITNTTGNPSGRTYLTSAPGENYLGAAPGQLPHKRDADNNDLLPYFKIPETTAAAGPASTATTTFDFGLLPVDLLNGIHTDIETGFEFDSYGISTGYKDDGLTAVTAVPGAPLAPGSATDVPIPSSIPITITTELPPLSFGFCMLVISFNVKPLHTGPSGTPETLDNPADWWILSNGMYDYELHDNNNVPGAPETGNVTTFTGGATGTGGASLGGAILLCIGDPPSATSSRPIKIIISKLGSTPITP